MWQEWKFLVTKLWSIATLPIYSASLQRIGEEGEGVGNFNTVNTSSSISNETTTLESEAIVTASQNIAPLELMS
jgi:hypothetical protein